MRGLGSSGGKDGEIGELVSVWKWLCVRDAEMNDH